MLRSFCLIKVNLVLKTDRPTDRPTQVQKQLAFALKYAVSNWVKDFKYIDRIVEIFGNSDIDRGNQFE